MITPTERPQAPSWTVSGLARALADTLFARFGAVTVQGEISGFTRAASGHCYFALRDAQAQLRCVMFRTRAALVDFDVRDGARVEIRAEVGIYEPRGDLQLNVASMRLAGQGSLLEQFQRLKEKLRAEGLFDATRKRVLPAYPRAVGIVTSPQAAALHDVLATLARRSPQLRVVLYPAAVQGAGAPAELLRALRLAEQRAEVDLLLLVRGGGAIEDLWAFNDEALARAVAACALPVISGVGHETDFTIADFVADLRAPTPTAAAELCAPASAELQRALDLQAVHLRQALGRMLARAAQRVDRLQLRLPTPARLVQMAALRLRDLQARLHTLAAAGLAARRQRLERAGARLGARPALELARCQAALRALDARLARAPELGLAQARQRLDALQARLELLGPAATLQRGYCLAWRDDGTLLREAAELRAGEGLLLATAGTAAQLQVGAVEPVAHPLATLRDAGNRQSS